MTVLEVCSLLEGNCSQRLAQKHHPAPTPGPGGSRAHALKHRQEAGWAVLRKLGVVLTAVSDQRSRGKQPAAPAHLANVTSKGLKGLVPSYPYHCVFFFGEKF